MISIIVDSLAEGSTIEEILTDYPTLQPRDIQAALAYAAELVREEDIVPLRSFA